MNLHNNEISQRLLNAKSVEQIKKLIEEKIDIHQSIVTQYSTSSVDHGNILFNADLEATKFLLSLGVDPNKIDYRGRNSLFRKNSKDKERFEIVKLLVEAGANIHQVNAKNKDVLCIAKNMEIAKYLIDKGANIELFKKREKTNKPEFYNAVIAYYEKIQISNAIKEQKELITSAKTPIKRL